MPEVTGPAFQIEVVGSDQESLQIQDLANFLYDFNLLYETLRLAFDPTYDWFRFTRFTGYRNGRRALKDQDRLRVDLLRVESPPLLVTILQALDLPKTIPIVVGFVTSIEIIYNIRARNRLTNAQAQDLEDKHQRAVYEKRIAKAQAEKLERENRREDALGKYEELKNSPDFVAHEFHQLEEGRAAESYSRVTARLKKSKLRIMRIVVDFIERPRK
jgi:hypothetical protein